VGWRWWWSHQAYLEVTEGCFNKPGREAEGCLDTMTGYFLWKRGDSARFEELVQQLQSRANRQPFRDGLDLSGLEFVQPVSEKEAKTWPLVLHYSSGRDLKPDFFNRDWQSFAKTIVESWGIPAPQRIALVEERTFPHKLLRLEAQGIKPVELEVELYESEAYVSLDDLPEPVQEFVDRFGSQWPSYETANKKFRIVPRWTLPVWKAAGRLANDGGGFPAFALANELLNNHPEALLTPPVFDYLLAAAGEAYPSTVAEARAARGSRLADDVAGLVRQGVVPKDDLVAMLDVLAGHPVEPGSPELSAEELKHELRERTPTLPSSWHGPWAAGRAGKPSEKRPALPEPYKETLFWFPGVPKPIRLVMGNKQVYSELTGDWDETRRRIDDDRCRFVRKFGFQYPGAFFAWARWEDPIYLRNELRIELQQSSEADARPIPAPRGQTLERLMAELPRRVDPLRVQWLTAETVSALEKGLDARLRAWLDARFSLTELKLLLRGVIAPEADELDERPGEAVAQESMIPPEHTIRHPEWLLRSLAFWTRVANSPSELVFVLRKTQRARLEWSPRQTGVSVPKVSQGIQALDDGNVALASVSFADAVDQDADAAVRAFLLEYPKELRRKTETRLKTACRDWKRPGLTEDGRLELEEFLEGIPNAPAAERRPWELCWTASLRDGYLRGRRLERVLSLLERDQDLSSWSTDQLDWTARELIRFVETSRNPRVREDLRKLLLAVLDRPGLGTSRAAALYGTLVGACSSPGRRRECTSLAEEIAEVHPTDSIPLKLGLHLATLETTATARKALEWLDRSAPYLEAMGSSSGARYWKALVKLNRAEALNTLAALGEEDLFPKAQELLEQLTSERADSAEKERKRILLAASSQLIGIHAQTGNLAAYKSAVDQARVRWPGLWEPLQDAFWCAIDSGDPNLAAAVSEELLRQFAPSGTKVADENKPVLFIGALAQLLTGQGRWEETGRRFLVETDDEYRDYVAMILFAFMANEQEVAKRLLGERWAAFENQADLWAERLRAGDERAWREMLIGYYLEHVDRSKIFDPLESDKAFEASDLSGLYMPRRALLCEAYFYDAMLQKARGKEADMRILLQKVIDTDYRRYLELKMARFLLAGHTASETTGARAAAAPAR